MRRFLVSLATAALVCLSVPASAQTPPVDNQAACESLPILARLGCQTLVAKADNPFRVIVGSIVAGPFTNALDEATRHVAGWAAERISKLYADVRANTSPDLTADWFVTFYNQNFFLAVILLSVVVVGAMLWGGIRGSGADVGEAIWGGGIAFALMFVAPAILKTVLEIVDWTSAGVLSMSGSSGEAVLTKLADGLRAVNKIGFAPGVNILAVFATAVLALVGAFILWMTFTIRNWLLLTAVATGVFVLLLKGTPAKKWVSHLASFQTILAFMPIPIAISLALAVHALGSIGTPTIGTDEVLGATGGLMLAGILPWKLFKYMPFLGMAAVAAMHNPKPAGHMARQGSRYTAHKVRSWSSTPTPKGKAAGAAIAGGSGTVAAAAMKAKRPTQPKITINVLNMDGFAKKTYYGTEPVPKPVRVVGSGGRELPAKTKRGEDGNSR